MNIARVVTPAFAPFGVKVTEEKSETRLTLNKTERNLLLRAAQLLDKVREVMDPTGEPYGQLAVDIALAGLLTRELSDLDCILLDDDYCHSDIVDLPIDSTRWLEKCEQVKQGGGA